MSAYGAMAKAGRRLGAYVVNHPESWSAALPVAVAVGVAYGGYKLYKYITSE